MHVWLKSIGCLAGALAVSGTIRAGEVSLQRIVDTTATLPGRTEVFQHFARPAFRDGKVAFFGQSGNSADDWWGVYAAEPGEPIELVADRGTPIPDGVGVFEYFSAWLSTDLGEIVFQGSGESGQRGIYLATPTGLSRIVDRSDSVPGGLGDFEYLDQPYLSAGDVVFRAKNQGLSGVYARLDDELVVIADESTPIPGGVGTFSRIDGAMPLMAPSISHGNVAFWGRGEDDQQGIYAQLNGRLVCIADVGTVVPFGDGTAFTSFSTAPQIDGQRVVFRGISSQTDPWRVGIYLGDGDTMQRVADLNTTVPGHDFPFDGLGNIPPSMAMAILWRSLASSMMASPPGCTSRARASFARSWRSATSCPGRVVTGLSLGRAASREIRSRSSLSSMAWTRRCTWQP